MDQHYNFKRNIELAVMIHTKQQEDQERQDRWTIVREHYDKNCDVSEIEEIFKINNIDCKEFASCVKNILQEKHFKINALRIWGVPNSGKSLIVRLITEKFYTYYGTNTGSMSEFFYGAMVNKSLIVIEELWIVPSNVDDFKTIFSGYSIDINQKHVTERQRLLRTPLFITSNHEKHGKGHLSMMDEEAINRRMYNFKFVHLFEPKNKITCNQMYTFLIKYTD